MNIPEFGTYVSENKDFAVEIKETNSEAGQIFGKYTAKYSPEGELQTEGEIGNYAWVYSDAECKDCLVAPFSIGFAACVRPDGRPYCIQDSWVGAYQKDGTLLMQGVRSYVNSQGDVKVLSLGTLTFSRS